MTSRTVSTTDNYWGPAAGAESSEWILRAARESIDRFDPDLLWVYVPHLDYDAQRHGPEADETLAAVEVVDELVGEFLTWLRSTDRWSETAVTVVNEYGFHDVERPVFPNRALRDAGLLTTVDGGGGEDVDLDDSRAFAMVDHQVAHVYTDEPGEVRTVLETFDGIDAVLTDGDRSAYDLDHPNAGDLVLIAAPDAWFQYYWWRDDAAAPEYATDVDIHVKPGYDPCELFFGDSGMASLDPTTVSGSHGRVDDGALGFFGLGGPAASGRTLDRTTVDARATSHRRSPTCWASPTSCRSPSKERRCSRGRSLDNSGAMVRERYSQLEVGLSPGPSSAIEHSDRDILGPDLWQILDLCMKYGCRWGQKPPFPFISQQGGVFFEF